MLARACGWLFGKASGPARWSRWSRAMFCRKRYTFPADDMRQGHLGFLLAWLTRKGDGIARARPPQEAERHSMSTSLDPPFERTELAPEVESFNEPQGMTATLRRWSDPRGDQDGLTEELIRRWS